MTGSLYLAFLAQHDDGAWQRLVDRLEQAVHPVDRAALRIWFHLYPLALQRAMEQAPDPTRLARRMALDGRWRLAEQIDGSHRFLYGHRYWPQVKPAVLRFVTRVAAPGSLALSGHIQEIARALAEELRVPTPVLVGIVAVGLRTLQQVGVEAFEAAAGIVDVPAPLARLSPDEMLAARGRDGRGGLLGFLRGNRTWSVTFDEGDADARFPLRDSQHITTAAGEDTRNHRARDPRCSEGPIPVHCRSCSCGTCWVGVLGGAERLSPMEGREREKLAECGYIDTGEERPVIRLACMAQAFGPVSIVIPPWNGRFGRVLKGTAPSP